VKGMQPRKAFGNKMFPHLLAVFQWILLIIILSLKMNFSIVVTGAVANGGLKVIMLFPFSLLSFSIALGLILYKMRKDGIAERCALGLSLITILFSSMDIILHFANDLILFMKVTEVTAWIFYNGAISVSIYKISVSLLLPTLKRFMEIENETIRNDKRLQA
jgi:hypothetical protein